MRLTYWIIIATDSHSEYVTLSRGQATGCLQISTTITTAPSSSTSVALQPTVNLRFPQKFFHDSVSLAIIFGSPEIRIFIHNIHPSKFPPSSVASFDFDSLYPFGHFFIVHSFQVPFPQQTCCFYPSDNIR